MNNTYTNLGSFIKLQRWTRSVPLETRSKQARCQSCLQSRHCQDIFRLVAATWVFQRTLRAFRTWNTWLRPWTVWALLLQLLGGKGSSKERRVLLSQTGKSDSWRFERVIFLKRNLWENISLTASWPGPLLCCCSLVLSFRNECM